MCLPPNAAHVIRVIRAPALTSSLDGAIFPTWCWKTSGLYDWPNWASGIRLRMEDAPTDSAVRAVLRVLEEKGLLRHRTAGFRYVYSPVVDRNRATRSVLQYLINTFFGGSPERAVAALLDVSAAELDSGELEKISDLIERARRGKA